MEETFSTSSGITPSFLNEYKQFKLEQQSGMVVENPEVIALLEGQAILVMEKINTGVVNQLLNAISQFDGFLSSNNLGSIRGVLAKSEATLNDVLTGKANDATAAATLANVMGLYNSLASFFKQDLPTILRTPIFRQAREVWSKSEDPEKMNLGQVNVEPDKMKQIFSNALNQRANTGVVSRVLNRFGKMQQLASGINPSQVATDLMAMSFTQLDQLAAGAPKPAPAGAPEQLVKQAEVEAKASATQGQEAQQQKATGGTPPPSNAIIAALQNSGNAYIAENARDIVAALAAAGFSVVSSKQVAQQRQAFSDPRAAKTT